MSSRNKNRGAGQQQPRISEKPMNEQVKQPDAGVPDAGSSTPAPAVDNVGTADQSQQASDTVESGTTATQPVAGAGEPSADAVPAFTFPEPEMPSGELNVDSDDEYIKAYTLHEVWREFGGRADLTDEQLKKAIEERTVELTAENTALVNRLKTEKAEAEAAQAAAAAAEAAKIAAAKPPAPAVIKPVVQSTTTAAQPSTAISGPTKYEEVNRALAGVPGNKLGVIHFLTDYSQAMAPRRPITDKDGALMQKQLYDALINLINKEDEHFNQLWSAVLRYVEKEITGVFSHTHAFRFMDNIPLNTDQQAAFASLVHLLRLTGPVSSRKENLKQVSLDKTLQKGVTDGGRQRVLAFYEQ